MGTSTCRSTARVSGSFLSVATRLVSELPDLELARRLLLAAALGGLIGIEREMRQKNAGLRTNMLIALGAALFTVMSIELSDAAGADPTRVASQIVTGVGFLGAGAIMRRDGGVQGLTTAATIWVNAAVGVAAGGGEYHLAVIGTAVTLVVLLLLWPLEKMIDQRIGKRRSGRNTPPTDA